MGNVEEISESEAAKLDYRKPEWPDTSKNRKGEFEKVLKSINAEGSLVETSIPGVYRIERVAFGPGDKCHVIGQKISGKEINMSLPISAAMEYIKESGFPQEAQKAYNNNQK